MILGGKGLTSSKFRKGLTSSKFIRREIVSEAKFLLFLHCS